jgi:hypothetical protein
VKSCKTPALCLLAGSLWMAAPAPAVADWLVTRDGGKVETRGAWKVEAKRVVFTAKDGTLASLRLAEVDLDASRQATSAAEQAKTTEAVKPAAPPRKSVRVLTDKDFPRAEPPAAPADATGVATLGTGENPAAPPSSTALQVANWKQERDAEHDLMKISGVVRNTGPDLATAVQVTIRLYEAGGELLATQQASLDTRTLQPGQGTAFQAEIPAINGFASAKFDARSIPLVKRPPPQTSPGEGSQTSGETGEESPPSR